ncbi:MAG: HAMP domain-containing protein, partial [Chloroflexi bacterium]|nr:HAMP domain-containing protein [Chloroflexota bacterium]
MRNTILSSLWFRLVVAFAIVAVVAVGTVAVLANLAMTREMERYLVQSGQARAERLQVVLLDYYEARGSWASVEQHAAFRPVRQPVPQPGQPKPPIPDRVILTDPQGRVIADSFAQQLRGKHIAQADLERAAPVIVRDQVVGYVLVNPPPAVIQQWPSLAEQYLAQVNQSLLWASLLTLLVTVVLGLWLSRQISAPLRRLGRAARGIAAGDLTRRAGIRGGGEIGELGRTFDHMAESLARQEELRQHMVADIAHELRTPLTVLQGNVEAMLDGVRPPSSDNLAAIHEETLLLARLVNDLRD